MMIEEQIRSYITESFLLGDGDGLDLSQSLLDSGVIDSTGVMELVMFLEETFGIDVNDSDLVPENLDTIANIAAFVQLKSQDSIAKSSGSDGGALS